MTVTFKVGILITHNLVEIDPLGNKLENVMHWYSRASDTRFPEMDAGTSLDAPAHHPFASNNCRSPGFITRSNRGSIGRANGVIHVGSLSMGRAWRGGSNRLALTELRVLDLRRGDELKRHRSAPAGGRLRYPVRHHFL